MPLADRIDPAMALRVYRSNSIRARELNGSHDPNEPGTKLDYKVDRARIEGDNNNNSDEEKRKWGSGWQR